MEKKEMSSETARSQRYLMTDDKSVSPSRGRQCHTVPEKSPCIDRPSPEGAGSTIDSLGAQCTGSDFSSPGSLSGSSSTSPPGTSGPPGSLSGSPGYGTGSLGSGSETSPESDRIILCEKCTACLEVLRTQALHLLVPRQLPNKDPAFTVLLRESVQAPDSAGEAWNERDSRCVVCATHLSQLKQEAVHMILTQERAIWASPPSANVTANTGTGPHTLPRTSSPQPSPPKPSQKPSSLGKDKWVEGRQRLEALWSISRTKGVTLYPQQMSQGVLDGCKEEQRGTVPSTVPCHPDTPLPSLTPGISTTPPVGTLAAVSFFVRAAQKLNLTSRRKKQCPAQPHYPTSFSSILQRSPPLVPPSLLQAFSRGKEAPGLGKVKVMLRVCPFPLVNASRSHPLFRVDPRKKQVTVLDHAAQNQQKQATGAKLSPKTFNFDAAFTKESSQAEVCEGTVSQVLQSVVSGADGCILSFGPVKVGKSYTMIGRDDCTQSLGIIPSAISWLFKLISKKKERTGSNISVSVSAVEVYGKSEILKDLLSGVEPGNHQDGQKTEVYLVEDPLSGIQLRNHSVVCTPTAEAAATLLDAAIACRSSSSRPDWDGTSQHSSHMFFTLHVYQHPNESSTKVGMCMSRSRLNLIDLGSCVVERSKTNTGLSLIDQGNIILALLNGSKLVPNKDSKLTMLLQESLSNINCHTTMIAHVSPTPRNSSETLSTIQIVSRIRRMQKKAKKYATSSPGDRSLGKERKMRRPTKLRAFHSAGTLDRDLSLPRLFGDLEDYSGSDQSCDTVICVDPNGCVLPEANVTNGTQVFVPIIPSLHKNKVESGNPLNSMSQEPPQTSLKEPKKTQRPDEENEQEPTKQQAVLHNSGTGKPNVECLKCNTFAELQERLGCIDGSELVAKFPLKEQRTDTAATSEPLPSLQNVVEKTVTAKTVSSKQLEMEENNKKLSTSERKTGSSVQRHPFLRDDSSVYDIEEAPSATLVKDGYDHPTGSPKRGIASLIKPTDFRQPTLGSQRCTEHNPRNITLSLKGLGNQKGFSDESLLQSEMRISPVGKSSPRSSSSFSSSSSSSLSTSLGSLATLPITMSDVMTHLPSENQKEMRATITVTVQQPLDLNGQDELVFMVVEEVTISGAEERGRLTNIVGFNDRHALQALVSGSQPVRIISSVSEEQSVTHSPTKDVTSGARTPNPLLPSRTEGKAMASQHSSIQPEVNNFEGSGQPCSRQLEYRYEIKEPCVVYDVASDYPMDTGDTKSLVKVENATDEVCEKKTIIGTAFKASGDEDNFDPLYTSMTLYPCIIEKTNVKENITQESMKIEKVKEARASLALVSSEMKINQRSYGELKPREYSCEIRPEKRATGRRCTQSYRHHSRKGEDTLSPATQRRLVDGCEVSTSENLIPGYTGNNLRAASLPRGWHSLDKQDDFEDDSPPKTNRELRGLGATLSTPCSPRATLERRRSPAKQGIFAWAKESLPFSSMRKYSPDLRRRTHAQSDMTRSPALNQMPPLLIIDDTTSKGNLKSPIEESSKLFSARLEQLASRSHSLGKSRMEVSDLQPLEHGNFMTSLDVKGCLEGDYNTPRASRRSVEPGNSMTSLSSKGSLEGDYTIPRASRRPLEQGNSMTSLSSKGSLEGDYTMSRASRSIRRSPRFFLMDDRDGSNNTTESSKASLSKISAVSKLMSSPKVCRSSATSSKNLSFSPKSIRNTMNRSSSLSPDGTIFNQSSWSTQSLSRNQGLGFIAKSPLKIMNERICELMRGSADSFSNGGQGGSDLEEREGSKVEDRLAVHPMPSPYSRVTAPRKPYCCSGHASDNTSVLSGELPPAMGKTALLYNRNSVVSSGYESMVRDSEATGSSTSARNSISDQSCSLNTAKSVRSSRRRNNIGSHQRWPSQDTLLSMRRSSSGPRVRWVDRGIPDSYEIKVYEIDDVERLQRKGGAGNKGVVCFSAKLKFLEHRQQRIVELRAKYNALRRELELAKQHLMLDPGKWTREYDLWQTFEVDSLEHLEALELVTERLESRVNLCKAHVMMVTCFDVAPKRRQRRRCRPSPDHKGYLGI